jgi:hypothetical protein
MGRRGPTPEADAKLRQLEQTGAEVRIVQGDVSLATDVERALSVAAEIGRPLRGIIHSAGVLSDGALVRQDARPAGLRFSRAGRLALNARTAQHLGVVLRDDVIRRAKPLFPEP